MRSAFFALTFLTAACAPADGIAATHAVYRPPLGASAIGVGFVTLRSATQDRIVGVSSARAKAVEIHATVTEGANSSMHRVDSVELPAGKDVVFGPGGMHLMVFEPDPAGSKDATFPIQFELESGGTKIVAFRGETAKTHGN